MELVSGHKLEGKPFHYQSVYFSPLFFCARCASSLTLYVFFQSGESKALHYYKGIILIILTLAYQVTILMIIHCTFGLVFLNLFNFPLDTLWQQQISIVEKSFLKLKVIIYSGCCSRHQNPSNNLPYIKPEVSSERWQFTYSQNSSLFTSFTLHLGWYSPDISICPLNSIAYGLSLNCFQTLQNVSHEKTWRFQDMNPISK